MRRREKLREALRVEEEALAEELSGARVSGKARRMALEERARALLAQREAERLKLKEDLEYKKWKESNQACRAEERAQMMRDLTRGRQMQIEERRRLEEQEKNRSKQLNAAIERRQKEDLALFEEREAASRASRDAYSRELRAQMCARKQDRLERFEHERAERAALNARWENERVLRERFDDEKASLRRDICAQLLRENEQRQVHLLKELERERERDAEIIRSAVEAERLYEEEQTELARRRTEEEILFRKYLEDLMAQKRATKQRDDETVEQERLRHEERMIERENLENYQRHKLMQEVNAIRGQQIAESQAKKLAAAAEERELRRSEAEALELARRQLDEKLKLAKQENVMHRKDLEMQIQERQQRSERADYESNEDPNVEQSKRFAQRFEEERKFYSF